MWLADLPAPPTSTPWDAIRSHPKEPVVPMKQWAILTRHKWGSVTVAQEGLIRSPSHSILLCQQTQVGCSFCGSYGARGSRLWNTMFIEIGFHLRTPMVAPASWCAFCLQLSSPDAFLLFVLGGRQHLYEAHSLLEGKGHHIVLDKALSVRMSPVSLEHRRNITNKILKKSKPQPSWLNDEALALSEKRHKASRMTLGRHMHAWWLLEQEIFVALIMTVGTVPQATNSGT